MEDGLPMVLGIPVQPNVVLVNNRACAVAPTLPLHTVGDPAVAQRKTPENALGPTVKVGKRQL